MNDSNDLNLRLAELQAILKTAVDAIILINAGGTIQSVNPATVDLFRFSEAELIGKNVSILMPEPFRSEHDGYLANYLATGERKIIGIGREVIGQRSDGTRFPIHLAVSEIQIGQKRMFSGIVRDISDIKHVEQKLVQSERLAAIGELATGLAHESRNAFQRSHACLANLALDVREMPESLDLVRKIQRALDDLNLLLEEVRDYAAPIVLEKNQCHLPDVVRRSWDNVKSVAKRDPMPKFSISVSDDFPGPVKLDRVRMEQVFRNLLENALVACRQQILVSCRIVPGSELPVTVEVHDDGTGVPGEKQEKVFEPFFTTKTKGTGLGLAICGRIIESHGGRITVAPSNHGGACFQVLLPCQ